MVAQRNNAGKPQLSYLLDMPHALSDLAYFEYPYMVDPVRAMCMFAAGKDSALLQALMHCLSLLEYGLARPSRTLRMSPGALIATYPKAFAALARVFEFGAKKYARGDWKKGRPVLDTLDSAMRHYLLGYMQGEKNDPESGQPHLAHVIWNLMAIMEYLVICPEMDDRILTTKEENEA